MRSDYVDELQAEAHAAMATMREAALVARRAHARAELVRHMRTTARKVRDHPREAAVAQVVREWMQAWGVADGALAGCEPEMRAFTAAFCAETDRPGESSDHLLRRTTAALEGALLKHGTTLADLMAWRSECAHGWWELVDPTPAGRGTPGRRLPKPNACEPFWTAGCAEHCRPADPDAASEASDPASSK